MIPLPQFLPGANSRKWHSRRWWDPMGHLRARTISNPNWQRQTTWLTGVMKRHRPPEPGHERDLFDAALEGLGRYEKAVGHKPGAESWDDFMQRRERLWDDFLRSLDGYLAEVQRQHLEAVDRAGRSGRPKVEPPE